MLEDICSSVGSTEELMQLPITELGLNKEAIYTLIKSEKLTVQSIIEMDKESLEYKIIAAFGKPEKAYSTLLSVYNFVDDIVETYRLKKTGRAKRLEN